MTAWFRWPIRWMFGGTRQQIDVHKVEVWMKRSRQAARCEQPLIVVLLTL